MCCYKHPHVIDECNALFDENGEATFYKVVKINPSTNPLDVAISIFGDHKWKPGINKTTMSPAQKYNPVYPRGFHVYLTKIEAEWFEATTRLFNKSVIIEVVCNKKHLITAGYATADFTCVGKQAVYSHITITQQEWDEKIEPYLARENQL